MASLMQKLGARTSSSVGLVRGSRGVANLKSDKRSCRTQAYVEPSVTYAVTQQAVAYAVVLGGDVFLERASKSAPDWKICGAGTVATAGAVAILNSGESPLVTFGMALGLLTSLGMMVYHVKRAVDAEDPDADWPGPKAPPGVMALISFFALNAFLQGLRAEL